MLRAGTGDLKQAVLMPNVITPNEDGYNDAFRPPVFAPGACIGNFRTIQVYNRWGKVVFRSTDPHFAWRAEGCPGGMYFYEIRYSNFSLRGGLSILY
jgi:gliding motility-associated-like protein